MLIQFLAVSGLAFWIILAAVVVLDIFMLASDNEVEGWAVAITTGAFVGAILFTDAFKGMRVGYLVAGVAVYLVAGVLWSLKKWYDYVLGQLTEMRQKYNTPGYVNKDAKGNETFEDYARRSQPRAAYNKQRIVSWMALWPFSFSWWVLTWPRHAFVWLYNRLSTVFDRISDRIWASAR